MGMIEGSLKAKCSFTPWGFSETKEWISPIIFSFPTIVDAVAQTECNKIRNHGVIRRIKTARDRLQKIVFVCVIEVII